MILRSSFGSLWPGFKRGPSTTTLNLQISATGDDAGIAQPANNFGTSNIAVGSVSPDLYWGGLRFLNVTIPQGTPIISATLTMAEDSHGSGATWGAWYSYADDNPPAWSTTKPDVAARGSATVTITGGTLIYDVTALVQESINRAGFASGNAIGLIANPTGASLNTYIDWVDYGATPANAAKLTIIY